MALSLPLQGFRVVDLTQVYSGPYCGFLLAQAGAEVIKVEPPGGESLRMRDGRTGAAAPFAMLNGGKRSITLDLKSLGGSRALRDLLRTADVLLENFRPGVLDRLGFGADVLRDLNPRLIKGAISGFGSRGPNRDYPAMDLTVQAMSGVMDCTGMPDGPPLTCGAAISDLGAGAHLYGAVVSALLHRERTGAARDVEVAMVDTMLHTLASNVALAMSDSTISPRTGNRHGGLSLCPYNVYPTADGHIAIICIRPHHWTRLVETLDLRALAGPQFETMQARVDRMDEVDDAIAAVTVTHRREDIFRVLNEAGVPCGSVRRLREVLADPHLHETGMLLDVDHEEYGRLTLPHTPLRFVDEERPPYRVSPRLGADNDDVLASIGMTSGEIDDLRRTGMI